MKLTTGITNFLVLFSIILNGVSSANSLKKHNIETILKRNTSNIQISLNNTSNQISLIFEDKENSNLKTEKDENLFSSGKPENSTFAATSDLAKFALENIKEKLIVSSKNNLNLEDRIKNINGIEPQEESFFEIKEINETKENSNLKKNTQQINLNTLINHNKNNNNQNENIKIKPNKIQQTLSYSNTLLPKKIKYSEALKNIQKIKSRLSNSNNQNSKNFVSVKDPKSASSSIKDTENENLSANELSKITEANIKDEILFEEFLKQKGSSRRKKFLDDDNNSFMFYNSLSLIMLSMLGGGVVGVIFILYFTFKNEGSNRYE